MVGFLSIPGTNNHPALAYLTQKRAAYTGLTPTWGTSSLIMTVYYFNASHLRRSLVPRGVLEAFRPTFGNCHKKCERTGEDNFHLQPGS